MDSRIITENSVYKITKVLQFRTVILMHTMKRHHTAAVEERTYVFGWTGGDWRTGLRRGRPGNRETFQRVLRVTRQTLRPVGGGTPWRRGHDGASGRQRARLLIWNGSHLVLVSWRAGRLRPCNTHAHTEVSSGETST